MRAGMALSAVGHVALVALALWALPWLRVRPEPPVPAITVSFVGEADLAALARRAAAAKAPAPPQPAAAAPAVRRVPPAPRFAARREPEVPEAPVPAPGDLDLAPGFDAASPLGIAAPAGRPAAAPSAPSDAPTAEEEVGAEATIAHASVLRERYLASLATAVLRARIYPPAARGRGLIGVARLYLVVARDGSLVELQLMASSGSVTLDQAAVDAARRARLPSAPDDLPGESFSLVQDLAFDLQ